MKSIAIIKHMYLFDPASTWQNGSQFEKDLADFFAANGFEAQLIETKGNATERVFFIQRIETNAPKLDNKAAQPKPLSNKPTIVPKSFKQFSSRPFLKGIAPTRNIPQTKVTNFKDIKFHANKDT
jgi:hypothetical protein